MEHTPDEKPKKREYPVERIIGRGFDAEDVEIAEEIWKKRFNDQEFATLHEREKTPEELVIIDEVNAATDALLAEYGMAPLTIPAKNIHIIAAERWPGQWASSAALYSFQFQSICYRDSGWSSSFAYRLFHEMLHIKSHQAVQFVEGEKGGEFRQYRSGLSLSSETRDEHAPLFSQLNEAVIETLAIRYWRNTVTHDKRFSGEMKKLEMSKKEARADIDGYAKEIRGTPAEAREMLKATINFEERNGKRLHEVFSYTMERYALDKLVGILAERSGKSPRIIYAMFIKSVLTGYMVELARLIDTACGSGTFRTLGHLSRGENPYASTLEGAAKGDEEELIAYIDSM